VKAREAIMPREKRVILWIASAVSLVFWLTPLLFPLLMTLKGN
jgi:hypothetical protein